MIDPERITVAADPELQAETEDSSGWNSRRQPARRLEPAEPLRGNETVLLVSDDPKISAILARILGHWGYRTWEASGAMEAQRLAGTREKIDLLFTDFSATDNPGLELAMWFRAIHPKIKVLVSCASLWNLNYLLSRSHKITFLAKPFTPLELGRIVRRILD